MSESSFQGRPGGQYPRRNLTEGPIAKTLILFSLPMLGTNVLQSLNLTANQFWVSHLLGVTAIAAIGNANVIGFLAQGAIFGATMAANIMIAQAVGAEDFRLVKRVMGTAISFFFVLSFLLAFLGWNFAPHVLTLMRTPPAARADAIIYMRIVFAAMPFMYFFMFLQMAQRGAGDSRTPFYFMALAVVLDVIFNPLLIAGIGPFPKLGIAGSAASTLIGQGVSLALLLVYLYRKHSVIMLRPHELGLLVPDWSLLRPLLVRGLPMSLQMFIMSGAAMVMIGFVNGFGAVTSAAYIGAQQVWNYIQMPGMAVGASISSMAGQNVGAGKWDRVSRIAGVGILLSVMVTGTCAALIYLLGPIPLYPFLPFGSPTVPIALHIDRTVLWAFVIFNATFALTGIVVLHRRCVAADDHPRRLDVADPRAVRTLHDPALRSGSDLVELPARHYHLERAVGAVLQVRRLAEGPHDPSRGRRRGAGRARHRPADGPARERRTPSGARPGRRGRVLTGQI